MASKKLSQVASELGVKPRELLEFARKHKFQVATIQSYMDEVDIRKLKTLFKEEREGKKESKPTLKKRVRKRERKEEKVERVEEAVAPATVEEKVAERPEAVSPPAAEDKAFEQKEVSPSVEEKKEEVEVETKVEEGKEKPEVEKVEEPGKGGVEEKKEEVKALDEEKIKEELEKIKKKVAGKIEEEEEEEEEKFHPRRRIVMKRKRKKRPRREEEELLRELEEEEPELKISEEEEKQEKVKKEPRRPSTLPPKKNIKIKIGNEIEINELAKSMSVKIRDVMRKLKELGMDDLEETDTIDFETASIIATEFGVEVQKAGYTEEELLDIQPDKPEDLVPRPPVVTVMGHVDHGKTTLLDTIRQTRVAEREAGGITQHIGASVVELKGKGTIVFIDTPGHEAFTQMRARGAQVTDIVVLVVAADDGVMPQTEEAISHARAAGVPIVVAINKIDVPNANPDRVKKELAERGLIPEEWGGDTLMVEVSARQKIGIEDLLEMIILQAEMLELKANPKKRAEAVVIESRLDKHRGPLATVIVKNGTLHVGDYVVAGINYGKVRALINDVGKNVKSVGPSFPAEVMGLDGVAPAGEKLYALKNEDVAKKIVELRKNRLKKESEAAPKSVSLEDLFRLAQEGDVKELNIVLKTDVQGTAEAVKQALEKLSTDEVKVRVVHTGVGGITESDVMLASASKGIIIGFNVRPDNKAMKLAKTEGVEIYTSRVIYELVDLIKKSLEGMLAPEEKEVYHGRAEVRQTFNIPKVGTVAGCYVVDGFIRRSDNVRVIREGKIIFESRIASLKRFKEDVTEVKEGYECGVGIEGFNDIKLGDILEAFEIEKVKKTL